MPDASALGDDLLGTSEDLVLALVGKLGVEHEQHLVGIHVPEFLLPLVSGGPAVTRASRERRRRAGQEVQRV